jgi:glycine dehydrogenase subunit 1
MSPYTELSNMRFLPHTDDEIRSMLATIGVGSLDALFATIPESHQLKRPLALEPALDEVRLMRHLGELEGKNDAQRMLSFLGEGIYDHHVPPVVDQMLLRGEFMTAYTPYQAEVAQGTLQAIFEFQTIVSEVLGLPIANASMYDGASAAAEAVLMARRITKRTKVLLSKGLHPEYAQVVHTYLQGLEDVKTSHKGRRREQPLDALAHVALNDEGRTDLPALKKALEAGDIAAVVIGEPNVLGILEDVAVIAELAHAHGALLITASPEPVAFSLVEPPGPRGADIAVGEGQPLGVPAQLGGPGVGLFACRDGREYLTQIPGRLVGETVDVRGKRGYVLTLSTREQHIRRERATSNICTNHSLMALAVAIRMCLLGKQGFVELGEQCLSRAEYLKGEIGKLPGYDLPYAGSATFNEFVVRRKAGDAAPLLASLSSRGIAGGVDLGRWNSAWNDRFAIAVTERHSREDLDRLVAALAAT